MLDLLKKLFGAAPPGDAPAPAEAEAVEYKGYRIIATPRREAAGWRVAGRIEGEVDGTPRQHAFVRADVYPGEDDTVQASVQKGRLIIDQQGDRLFEGG